MPDDTPAAPDAPGAPPLPGAPAATDKTTAPAAPTKSTPTEEMTTVRLRFPHDSFDTGIEDVPVITRQPVEIPTAKVEAVQVAARKSRVTVITIEEEK